MNKFSAVVLLVIFSVCTCTITSKKSLPYVSHIDLDDFDDLELQSLHYLNRERQLKGIKAAVLNHELMVMAQNEADRLANLSHIEAFRFNVDKKLTVNLFRIVGKNAKGKRIGLKKCYNLNDKPLELDFYQVYHVDQSCKTTQGKRINCDLFTDFGYGRAFDLANNITLYHLRLFYYSGNLDFDLNMMASETPSFHKYGKNTGLKFLKIQ